MKICSKTHQIAPSKNFPWELGSMPPNPPSKRLATPRVESSFAACKLAQPPQKLTPLAYHTYSHGLLLRNLFEEIRL